MNQRHERILTRDVDTDVLSQDVAFEAHPDECCDRDRSRAELHHPVND